MECKKLCYFAYLSHRESMKSNLEEVINALDSNLYGTSH